MLFLILVIYSPAIYLYEYQLFKTITDFWWWVSGDDVIVHWILCFTAQGSFSILLFSCWVVCCYFFLSCSLRRLYPFLWGGFTLSRIFTGWLLTFILYYVLLIVWVLLIMNMLYVILTQFLWKFTFFAIFYMLYWMHLQYLWLMQKLYFFSYKKHNESIYYF